MLLHHFQYYSPQIEKKIRQKLIRKVELVEKIIKQKINVARYFEKYRKLVHFCLCSVDSTDENALDPTNIIYIDLRMEFLRSSEQQRKNQQFLNKSSTTMKQLQEEEKFLIQRLQEELSVNKMLLFRELAYNYYLKLLQDNGFRQQTFYFVKNNSFQDNTDKRMMENYDATHINKKIVKLKNKSKIDTKNIPKNFGTAISIYIKNNPLRVKKLLRLKKISLNQFITFSKMAKNNINSLVDLRKLWSPSNQSFNNPVRDCYRIISYQFINKHSLKYIFCSRIKNTKSHIRYRRKILQGMNDPCNFNNLKDY